jgi:hypothetical protein
MNLINFDFTQHNILTKLAAINIPIIIIDTLMYPILRTQHLIISKLKYFTSN